MIKRLYTAWNQFQLRRKIGKLGREMQLMGRDDFFVHGLWLTEDGRHFDFIARSSASTPPDAVAAYQTLAGLTPLTRGLKLKNVLVFQRGRIVMESAA